MNKWRDKYFRKTSKQFLTFGFLAAAVLNALVVLSVLAWRYWIHGLLYRIVSVVGLLAAILEAVLFLLVVYQLFGETRDADEPGPEQVSVAASAEEIRYWSRGLGPVIGLGDVSIEMESAFQRQKCVVRTVFYATDRQPRAKDGSMLSYEGERHEEGKLSFGICSVTIPAGHRIGSLERPSIWRFKFSYNPSRHVTLVDVEEWIQEDFLLGVKGAVKLSERKEAFVFIHGYNVSFEDAARRTAQIAEDLKFDGAAIFYSWPSKAEVRAYPVDETNIRWTVPHLKAFLTQLAEALGVSTIHLIGHSMGNRAVADVLEAWPHNEKQEATFRHVVMTAPDIDAETFKELAAAIRPAAQRLTMYSSENDKALMLSRQFHGYARAGERILIVTGVDTIDASAVDTSFLGHSYASENRSVLQDIYALLTSNAPPEKRFGMVRKERPEGIYYAFHP